MPPPITRAYYISGRVQGVGFRAHTQAKALELSLCGAAINLNDGRVYVEALGAQDSISKLAQWLALGPRFARVDSVTEVPISTQDSARLQGLTSFSTG